MCRKGKEIQNYIFTQFEKYCNKLCLDAFCTFRFWIFPFDLTIAIAPPSPLQYPAARNSPSLLFYLPAKTSGP
jgi:hypothetical protein